MLTEALTIVQRHHLQLPSNLALLLKTLLMDEALGTMLDPTFNMTAMLEPYSKQLVQRQYSFDYWWRNVSRAGVDAARLGLELPQHIRRLMSDLDRGNIEVGVKTDTLKPIINEVKQMVNRVVLGFIAAAFIIGVAVRLVVYHTVIGLWWVGALFIIGFVLSFLHFWLLQFLYLLLQKCRLDIRVALSVHELCASLCDSDLSVAQPRYSV